MPHARRVAVLPFDASVLVPEAAPASGAGFAARAGGGATLFGRAGFNTRAAFSALGGMSGLAC